ncbi:hypothetical protein TSUD_96290 [Trifolium subterraneum]|nr:hypothetical protein TSUD_96290 [Trifolium subterraneum]
MSTGVLRQSDSNGVASPPVSMWEQIIKNHEGDGHGVIEFLNYVAVQLMVNQQKTITLIDEQNAKSYDCDIESINDGSNDKYVAKGWFKYLEEIGLNDGENVLFYVEDPPKKMYVYRLDHSFY